MYPRSLSFSLLCLCYQHDVGLSVCYAPVDCYYLVQQKSADYKVDSLAIGTKKPTWIVISCDPEFY